MHRRGGRRAGVRGAFGGSAADFASLLGMFDVAAFTANRNTAVATKVGSFQCWKDPTHLLEQGTDAVRVLLPTPDSAAKGQLSCAFVLLNFYVSNKAATFWTGRHDGVNWEEYDVYVPTQVTTTGALNTLGDTTDAVLGRSGAISSFAGPNTNRAFLSIQNATAQVAADSAAGVTSTGAVVYSGFSATGAVFTKRVRSGVTILTTSNTPLATAPANTLRMGLRHSGLQGLEARWLGKFVRSSPFTTAQRARFQYLMRSVYGAEP